MTEREERTGASFRVVVVVLGVLAALTIVLVWLPSMSLREQFLEQARVDVSRPVPGFGGRSAIAVLPFEDLSGGSSPAYFADGFAGDIIAALQSQRSNPVIARDSTFAYGRARADARRVAGELGAGYVLQGTVERHAGMVAVSVGLHDADGQSLWSEEYDRALDDVFDIEHEIATKVLASAAPGSSVGAIRPRRPTDVQAWDQVVKAAAAMPASSLEQSHEIEAWVRNALELDPGFARAYVVLGRLYAQRAIDLHTPFDETMGQAIDHARSAKRLDPFEVALCSCLGNYLNLMGLTDEALREHAHALDLDPSSAPAHAGYMWALIASRRHDEALNHARIAMRLSPRDPHLNRLKAGEGISLMLLGDLDGGIGSLRQSLTLDNSWFVAHLNLIAAETLSGRGEVARRSVRRMLRVFPDASLAQLMRRFPREPALVDLLRKRLRDDFPGDVDSAADRDVFAELLRQAGWDGVVARGG